LTASLVENHELLS